MSYELEMYKKALDEQAKIFAVVALLEPPERKDLTRGLALGYRRAAEMLQMSDAQLFKVYPNVFPDPEKEEELNED